MTDELQTKLCNIISRGHYPEVACAAVGLGKTTYYTWMQKGEDHTVLRNGVRVLQRATPRYAEFREAVEKARAHAQMLAMESIRDAAFTVIDGPGGIPQVRTKTWTAAAWFLERTAPQQYGRQVLELQGRDGGPIKTDASGVVKIVRFGGRFKKDGAVQTSAKDPSAPGGDDSGT